MTNIHINYNVSPEALKRVEDYLDHVATFNPSWNGANFNIVRDDYTCIPDSDSYDAVTLLNGIYKAIDNRGEG